MSFDFETLTTEGKVNAAYVAYYGRAADAEGRAFWANELEAADGNLDAIIDAFGTSAEAEQRYGGREPADAITALYQDLFGRGPDSEGLAFYTGELEAGRITLQSLALDILNGATNDDATLISNRLEVADRVTDAYETLENPIDPGFARFVIGGVDASENSLETVNGWLTSLESEDPPFAALGRVATDERPVGDLPTGAESVLVGASAFGLLDLNENGESLPQELIVSAEDGGLIRVGDSAPGLLRVDGEALEAQGAGNTIRIGDFDSGLALLEDGATLSTVDLRVGENGRGEMILTGEGTQATVSSANGVASFGDYSYLAIGRPEDSYGKLAVDDGAAVDVLTPDGNTVGGGILIAAEENSRGELIVDGGLVNIRDTDGLVGSRAGEYGDGPYLTLGAGGSGRLDLLDSGKVTLEASSTRLLVGDQRNGSDAQGVMNISDGSSFRMMTAEENSALEEDFILEHYAAIGRDGGTGELNITNGGVFEMVGRNKYATLELGRDKEGQSAGSGSVTVSGAGSRLEVRNENTASGEAFIGVGRDGEGSMTLENGATLVSEFVTVGSRDGSNGTFSMSGSGTTASLEGGRVEFGDIVYGTLFQMADQAGSKGQASIANGASMTIDSNDGDYTGIEIADGVGSEGELTITGVNSRVKVDGNGDELAARTASVEVGAAGTGSLTLEEGGRLTLEANGVMSVGTEVDGVGTVTVNGAGSVLDAGGLMIIGAPKPNDSVDRSALELSGGGEGTVTVGAGGTLRAGEAQGDGVGDIFIGANGTLRVEDGGIVEADVVNDAGGSFITGNSPGWAAIDGDFDSSGDLRMEFAGTGEGEYDRLDVTGEAVLSGLVTLDFSLDEGLDAGDRFTIFEADEGLDMAAAEVDIAGLAEGLDARTVVTETALQVELV
ncbi:DUF4214 domain-containing protein [Spiribacter aquaticus]|uniref:DUF4214 domain-containing protein n=1 Tax=Spiribacter aquaticus TaxID=1935996 RepID=A0A557RGN7_9GAMM|nr:MULTISPECIES: DUF4214 domain-containing protein [Spiribacter]KAF0280922.1 hypothetical protein BA897_09815 [Spiribacter roseus]TVO64320.1 DUF4214 domain-containing protein [Spiribacter aquaticus]